MGKKKRARSTSEGGDIYCLPASADKVTGGVLDREDSRSELTKISVSVLLTYLNSVIGKFRSKVLVLTLVPAHQS